MFKILFGAAIVVALVGYGVITTDDVQQAGDQVRKTVNTVLTKGAEITAEEQDSDLTQAFKDLGESIAR